MYLVKIFEFEGREMSEIDLDEEFKRIVTELEKANENQRKALQNYRYNQPWIIFQKNHQSIITRIQNVTHILKSESSKEPEEATYEEVVRILIIMENVVFYSLNVHNIEKSKGSEVRIARAVMTKLKHALNYNNKFNRGSKDESIKRIDYILDVLNVFIKDIEDYQNSRLAKMSFKVSIIATVLAAASILWSVYTTDSQEKTINANKRNIQTLQQGH